MKLTECVVLNGKVINIGPWDYKEQYVEVTKGVYEKRIRNPIPEGAEIVMKEVVEGPDGGLYQADYIPPKSDVEFLGGQLVEKEIQIMSLQNDNEFLGQQVVDLEIRLMQGGL